MLIRLDAFGDDCHFQPAGHGDNGAQQDRALFAHVADKRLVELDHVERKLGQVGE
ncbi:hypothetical protein D3C86_2235440 [compost metagenome]